MLLCELSKATSDQLMLPWNVKAQPSLDSD
jgi:hypothetical protein